MDYENFEKKLIRKQSSYIRQLEEQMDVYREKDRKQELLIEELNRMLELIQEMIHENNLAPEGGGRGG